MIRESQRTTGKTLISLLYPIWLLLLLALVLPQANALSPGDAAQLTAALETLSVGHEQVAEDSSRAILFSDSYSVTDFSDFFDAYFIAEGHAYTNALADFLQNNAFYWDDPEPGRLKLQRAFRISLWNLLSAITANHSADLGQVLYADAAMRQSIFNAHKYFAILAKDGLIEGSERTAIYADYRDYMDAYPQYFKDVWLDPSIQPLVPELRGQVWISLTETLPLTEALRAEIAETLELAGPGGRKHAIWSEYGLMVIDNDGYSADHLDVMIRILNAIPSELLDPAQPGNLRYVYLRSAFQTTPDNESVIGRGSPEALNYRILKGGGGVDFEALTENGLVGIAGGELTSDAWTHVVATYSNGTVSVYINGVLSNSGQLDGTPIATGEQPLFLGSDPRFFDEFKGALDDVKVYQRALSAGEVANAYAGVPISSANLVASYSLDAASGTLVADSSGSGNNGTRSGASIVPGRTGNALRFDGLNDYVAVPHSPSLAGVGAFTLETWIYWVNETIWPHPGNADAVNLFAPPVGEAPSNEFPSDITPATMDLFTSVMVHEFNHSVDHFGVQGVPAHNARLHQLIAQAGTVMPQYLRSQILEFNTTSFFVNYPQEMFASMSQQYFCDTEHMLRLGKQRFNSGYHEPLNQFLFFADIYSYGRNSTYFYRTDDYGFITRSDVPFRHGVNGGVRLLAFNERCYKFTTDANKNVISYLDLPDADSDGLADSEEALYGAHANIADTDGDGVSDLDEVWYDDDEAFDPFDPTTNVLGTDLDPTVADSDGDGLHDGWELTYSFDPLDTTGINGGDGDADNDGFTNLEEMIAGSNPRNASSFPGSMPAADSWALGMAIIVLLTLGRKAVAYRL